MRTPLFALLAVLFLAAAARASSESDPSALRPDSHRQAAPETLAPAERDFPDLTSGRYEIRLSGLVCSVCTRAVVAEVSKLDEVASAKANLERETLVVEIKPTRVLKIRRLKRALRKAAKRADFGTQYQLAAIRYIP